MVLSPAWEFPGCVPSFFSCLSLSSPLSVNLPLFLPTALCDLFLSMLACSSLLSLLLLELADTSFLRVTCCQGALSFLCLLLLAFFHLQACIRASSPLLNFLHRPSWLLVVNPMVPHAYGRTRLPKEIAPLIKTQI